MASRVLVTGGFGYLGGRIALYLAQTGRAIRIVERREAVTPVWAKKFEIVAFPGSDVAALTESCRGADAVIHLAAMNEVDAAKDPIGAMRVNAMDSLVWLEAAIAAGAKRFIYFSTAHVYAAPLAGTFDEIALPRPRHPYAISHRVMEDFVLAAHVQRRISGLVVRLSNGIGCPADAAINRWMLLANDLCREAVTKGTLTLKTSGIQLRDFITLGDIGKAMQHFLDLPDATWADGLFNLGSGKAISVFELAGLIAARAEAVFGRPVPLTRRPPTGDEHAAPLDYRIDKLLGTGFKPQYDLAAEIDATLRLCKEAFGSP